MYLNCCTETAGHLKTDALKAPLYDSIEKAKAEGIQSKGAVVLRKALDKFLTDANNVRFHAIFGVFNRRFCSLMLVKQKLTRSFLL